MKQAIEHENISPNVIAIPIKGLPMDNWSWTGDLGHSHLGPASISGSDLKEDGSRDTPYKDNKIYRSDCIEKVVCPGVRADDFFIKRVF